MLEGDFCCSISNFVVKGHWTALILKLMRERRLTDLGLWVYLLSYRRLRTLRMSGFSNARTENSVAVVF